MQFSSCLATFRVALVMCALTFAGAGTAGGVSIAHAARTIAESSPPAWKAWKASVLYSFSGAGDGGFPYAGILIADASGALYGTTSLGGSGRGCQQGCGIVFKLTPPAFGKTNWTLSVLHAFTGTGGDGSGVYAGLIEDEHGALYGTTSFGGGTGCFGSGCGTVFKLTPPTPGKTAWMETILHAFSGGDGEFPYAGLIGDAHGALYGTTEQGGSAIGCGGGGCGTVFKLTPPTPGHPTWNYNVLHAFTGGPDGGILNSGLIADMRGDLFGTTSYSGGSGCDGIGCGTVFKLEPPAAGRTTWTETVLYTFTGGADGAFPDSGLIGDARGAVYGATYLGGTNPYPYGRGIVFKLAPLVPGKAPWRLSVLHAFSGPDGSNPQGSLIADARGTLYGMTIGGGNANCFAGSGCGTVFKLTPPMSGQTTWTESVLHAFNEFIDGASPQANLLMDARGVLYGTTFQGGAGGAGTVFELRP